MSGRLLLVSNRLPVTVTETEGGFQAVPSAGGLASGLRGPHERGESLWIGWPGIEIPEEPGQSSRLKALLAEHKLVPVGLPADLVKQFYEGFSNGVIWPLFHYLLDRVEFDAWKDWDAYREANCIFADAVASVWKPGDRIWVHDYQLALLPGMIRERIPEAVIGFFLHIPFPSSEVYRTLPWRTELLAGLMGADLIGFHTFTYLRHFSSSLLRVLGVECDVDRANFEGRTVRLGVFPMSIDPGEFARAAEHPDAAAFSAQFRSEHRARSILLGVDRLDYTKGLMRRVLAVERLLEREPSLRGRIKLLQVVVPSREKVEAYEQLRRQLDEAVGHVNGRFSTIDWSPIQYLYRSLSQTELAALYRTADVMLVTPLRDGMNLVAKEFVASRTDERGVLVLSEFAGAASELGDALTVNPYDIDRTASAIQTAVEMPLEEQQLRMQSLREQVRSRDVFGWYRSFMEALEGCTSPEFRDPAPGESHPPLSEIVRILRAAPQRIVLLDYDGTLVPFAPTPQAAVPDTELLTLLRRLAASPGTGVHIVSGRDRATLVRWLGCLPVGLHAEHGFWSRLAPDADWTANAEINTDWKARVRPILEQFVAQTPGSLIEEKETAVAWHYRLADPEFGSLQAKELRLHLAEVLSNSPVTVLKGVKVVEIRQLGIHKGLVLRHFAGAGLPETPILAAGDDRTDEDVFASLPPQGYAVHVGPRPTRAPWRVRTPADVRRMLTELCG